MHFRTLEVFNFRAIKHAFLTDLTQMVVIAGPNGSGKSCLFDAIRFIKSAYGGYQPNEYEQFFGEFQIGINEQQPEQFLTLFQDRSQPIIIKLEVVLDETEKAYIRTNAQKLIRPMIWNQVVPHTIRRGRTAPGASLVKVNENDFNEQLQKGVNLLLDELQAETFLGELNISPDFDMTIEESAVLDLIFRIFLPQSIGIVDYHGAQRTYQREQIGGINLNIQTSEQQLSQHALYNYTNKYSNIKTEMAASYIRELLAQQTEENNHSRDSLLDTLKELFKTFFPEKEFLGVRPTADGKMLFPVRTEDGFEHDINDLSSGEKEVLYGYLRIHNASHRNSVLLLDEPELHLNPRLIHGLPQFYDKHLGRTFGNQIWLLTHSDTLLREALTGSNFSVFHMQQPSSINIEDNQIKRVEEDDELEQGIIGLVGDLATYQPGAKLVIFEGGGDFGFDLYMVNTLFPEFQSKVNPISVGNKTKVNKLITLLEKAENAGLFANKFFSIVDRDADEAIVEVNSSHKAWDVYHIENYLLHPEFILLALADLQGASAILTNAEDVKRLLHDCAAKTLQDLVRHQLVNEVNVRLKSGIITEIDRSGQTVAPLLHERIVESGKRIKGIVDNDLTLLQLEQRETEIHNKRNAELQGDEWVSTFRGRDILKRFVGKHAAGIKYEVVRNTILARMRDKGYKPDGMKKLIDSILSEN